LSDSPAAAAADNRKSEFAAAWKVLLAAMIGVACGASPLPFNSFGLFLGPINQEMGWGYGEISLGLTMYGTVAALLAPVFGSLADRFGVRVVALASLAAFAVTFGAVGATPAYLLGYYLLWFGVGLVGIGSTPVTWSRAINLWFFRNRGLALGCLLVGTSLAAMVVPRLTVFLIGEFGWRKAFPLLALLPLCVALPLGLWLFREPRPEEMPAELISRGSAKLLGMTLGEAIRGYRFWIIFASILCVAFAYGGAHIHIPQMLKGHGFTPAQAANVMGFVGLSIFAGRIFTGWLLDRFWAPAVTLPILCLPAISCWLLAGDMLSLPMAYLAGFLLGFAAGAESDLVAYLAGRYFGMAHYGQIYGFLYMPFGLASAVSPAVYGWVRDTTGNYQPILMVAMGLFVFGALLLPILGKYPHFRE
jgi:MFS family permease